MNLVYKTRTKLALLSLLAALCFSCQKATLPLYERDANIYFNLSESNRDSIVYTFAYDITKSVDTVFIPVQIMGYRADDVKSYQAYVEQDSSTAVAGIHYQALEGQYAVSSGEGRSYLPVIIYNVAELEEKSVSLIIKLRSSDDFNIENPRIIRARVVFSARLEQPDWWSMWLGAYSRTKHRLFLITTEQTTLTMNSLDAPKNLYFADLLRMMLNNPFRWVADNPEKGYVLEQVGSQDTYHFFHIDNPARPLILRRNPSSGQYFFIDENNLEVR